MNILMDEVRLDVKNIMGWAGNEIVSTKSGFNYSVFLNVYGEINCNFLLGLRV